MRICPQCRELFEEPSAWCPNDGARLQAAQDPMIGKVLQGRYQLISRLGSGGMSSVYLAQHQMIDRLVAIKILKQALAREKVQRDRFLREARAVNRINHRNIAEITDYGETPEGLVFLVMEYVPGLNLRDELDHAPFTWQRALHIAKQIAEALARAHQMSVIHRDLKPDNILLIPNEGAVETVKVLDFGVAKILDAPALSGSQQILGTPGYIAPEYIRSSNIDGRSDLYSLGVLLYEMLSGDLPFDYDYPGDLIVRHVSEQPIPLRQRHPSTPIAIEALVMQALEKDPNHRFRDAFHFIDELDRAAQLAGGTLVEGAPDTLPPTRASLPPGVREQLSILEPETLDPRAMAAALSDKNADDALATAERERLAKLEREFEEALEARANLEIEINAWMDRAREFRQTVGAALDDSSAALSAFKGRVAALDTQLERITLASREQQGNRGGVDALLWERVALEHDRAEVVTARDKIESKREALLHDLERMNEEHEHEGAVLRARLDEANSEVERAGHLLTNSLD